MKRFPPRPSSSSWQLGHRGQFRLWLWSSPTSPRAPHPPGVAIRGQRGRDWLNNTRRKRTGANGLGNQEDDKHYIYMQLEAKPSFKIKQEVSTIQTHGEKYEDNRSDKCLLGVTLTRVGYLKVGELKVKRLFGWDLSREHFWHCRNTDEAPSAKWDRRAIGAGIITIGYRGISWLKETKSFM